MKALHIVNDFSHGGAEAYVFSLLKEAASKDSQFSAALLHTCDTMVNAERLAELATLSIDVLLSRGSFFCFLKGLKSLSPDIIHCHNLKALIFAVASNFLCRKKARIVFTQHTSYLKRKGFHYFLRYFVDRYVAICEVATEDFREVIPNRKIVKLVNGVARSKRGDASLKKEGKCNIGMIARFHPIKNHRMLAESISILKEQGELQKFHFFLIGDGKERVVIEAMIKKNGCIDNVSFLGALRNAKDYIDSFDYLLLCSTNEGLPITVLESLEKKTPVIATRVGGVPDLILEGVNGYLVDNNNPASLARVLIKAAAPDSVRMFSDYLNAQDFNYSMDKVLQRHMDLYQEILR